MLCPSVSLACFHVLCPSFHCLSVMKVKPEAPMVRLTEVCKRCRPTPVWASPRTVFLCGSVHSARGLSAHFSPKHSFFRQFRISW